MSLRMHIVAQLETRKTWLRLVPKWIYAAWIITLCPTMIFGQTRTECGELDAPTTSKVLHAAAKLFRTEPSFPSIEVQKLVPSSCYWQLELSIPNSPRRLTLYLSPDHRFISSTLWDLSIDPVLTDNNQRNEIKRRGIADRVPTRGPDVAPVSILVFSDFQCPYCAQFAKIVDQYQKENPSHVQLAFRHSPLAAHPWAISAAYAGICMAEQNSETFWRFHDFVFSEQNSITVENIESVIAGFLDHAANIRKVQYKNCMSGTFPKERLEKDLAEARSYEIHGTPTVFINGARYSGFRDGMAFKSAISRALQLRLSNKAGKE